MKLLTPTLVLLFLLFTFSYTQAAMKDSDVVTVYRGYGRNISRFAILGWVFQGFINLYWGDASYHAVPAGFCGSKCKVRCSKASVQDRCLKYCGICCAKCKCVPSGTYGNKDQCPCYRDMLSSKGRPKCP
ncbi:hypothetical protein QJS10_CPB13g00467 [Acorus calamus]|uniref:Uncharacterized protein n=1 Tax=Acorus calamus TaxID=4465 RepID=A0AAV9DFE0_ACOCL|nr:hypothetical protein QJS10_CPB13g00467 [Acorus calamus]